MKIVHGITSLALLALIGGALTGLSGDILKCVLLVMAVGMWLEVINWSASAGKDQAITDEESVQASVKS